MIDVGGVYLYFGGVLMLRSVEVLVVYLIMVPVLIDILVMNLEVAILKKFNYKLGMRLI